MPSGDKIKPKTTREHLLSIYGYITGIKKDMKHMHEGIHDLGGKIDKIYWVLLGTVGAVSLLLLTAIRLDINNNPNSGQIEKLKALCENILQPVRDHFGRVKVTSGFRSEQLCLKIGSSVNSQHAKAEAADFECMGTDNAELADWIYENLDFDQLILEFYTPGEPNSGWIHCSYTTDQPRKQFLHAFKSEGKTKYKPVIGKATNIV